MQLMFKIIRLRYHNLKCALGNESAGGNVVSQWWKSDLEVLGGNG